MNYLTTSYTVRHAWQVCLSALLCWVLSAAALRAQSDDAVFPPRPEPAVYVHDYSGWLNGGQKMALEQKLRRYWDSTSTQIVVMIRPDLGDYDKASYAFELGKRWGIGRKDKNNGVVMLIKSEAPDRGIFIATGYGVEGALPDITAGRIIRNTMAPYFKQQQYYEGIDAGIDDIIRALRGEFKDDDQPEDATALVVVLLVFLTIFLLFLFLIYRARKKGTLYTHSGRGYRRAAQPDNPGGGWWWGTGGGWSSGGSWGGGDSGGSSWGDGGSFGGGDFGGGGAGGDW